jgi:hypothetical protein
MAMMDDMRPSTVEASTTPVMLMQLVFRNAQLPEGDLNILRERHKRPSTRDVELQN